MAEDSVTSVTRGDDAPRSGVEDTAADMYHDHQKALDWALRLEAVAWLPLGLAVLALAFLVAELYVYVPQVAGGGFLEVVLSLGIPVLLPLTAAVVATSFFVLLRAASQGLLLLLDIQEGPSAS